MTSNDFMLPKTDDADRADYDHSLCEHDWSPLPRESSLVEHDEVCVKCGEERDFPDTLETAQALIAAASGKCPPCIDGPCFIQPCGYHCKYPYTDDSTMWARNCPACQERREANARLTTVAVSTFTKNLEALEAVQKWMKDAPIRSGTYRIREQLAAAVAYVEEEIKKVEV